jgi:hypothetical protein
VKYVTERGGHEENEDQVGKVRSGPPCLDRRLHPTVLPLDLGRALDLHDPRDVRWRKGTVTAGSVRWGADPCGGGGGGRIRRPL